MRALALHPHVVKAGGQIHKAEAAIVLGHSDPFLAVAGAQQQHHGACAAAHLARQRAAAEGHGFAQIEVDHRGLLAGGKVHRLLDGCVFDAQGVIAGEEIGNHITAVGVQRGAGHFLPALIQRQRAPVTGVAHCTVEDGARAHRDVALPAAHHFRFGLERAHDGQHVAPPTVAVPGVVFAPTAAATQRAVAQQPKRSAKVIVGRTSEPMARPHHHAAGFQRLRHVQIGRRGRIARVAVLTDQVATLGGQDGDAAPQVAAVARIAILIGQPTGVVVHDGRAGAAAIQAQPVDLLQAAPAPGVLAPHLPGQCGIEAGRIRAPLLVADVIRVVQRAIAREVVDGLPDRAVKEILAPTRHDLAHQVPAAAVGDRGDGRHPPALQDHLQVGDHVLHRQINGVGGDAAALPFRVHIRLRIELEIAHPGANQRVHMHQVADVQGAGIGAGAIDAHHGHQPFGQEQFGKVNRAVVVENLDPLDAHSF